MSDHAINLIKAIESGDKEQMNTAFNDAMSARVSETLQARKIELASRIYNGAPQQSDEQRDDATGLESEASGDGSEEI